MKIEELTSKHELSEELQADIAKVVQGAEDRIRTDYTKQIKELEKLKPQEKTDVEIELESAKQQLKEYEFKASLSKLGVADDLSKYLKSDINLEEFSEFYKGFPNKQKENYVPKSHQKDVGITKESFQKMSISERSKLYTENPSLYETLNNK